MGNCCGQYGTRAPSVWLTLAVLLLAPTAGCSLAVQVDDPLAALERTDVPISVHRAAMESLDSGTAEPEYIKALQGIMWRPGYTVKVREAALVRLEQLDPEGLQRTIRQRLPRMTALQWRRRLCEIVAERGWVEQTPALVSGWARVLSMLGDDFERPEYLALAHFYGADGVIDVVYDTFVESNKVSQQGLRTRCWELLHRLGERERLVALIRDTDVADDDAMLADLRAGALDLGILPTYREEILWLRELRTPEHAGFWSEATQACAVIDPSIKSELELRDLPIIVAVRRHEPELLTTSRDRLYEQVASALEGRRHYEHGSRFDGGDSKHRLYEWRRELRWADLAAISIAIEALRVPQIVDHLFDYAERDRLDESTEYGGVIQLDAQGRFEVREFPPRIREHDRKFNAPQEMFDAAYTSLFHFHYHVQSYRNVEYAGPGFGDAGYADGTRSNCLVFTYVRKGAMNVDYYRHGRVLVDLGVIEHALGPGRG